MVPKAVFMRNACGRLHGLLRDRCASGSSVAPGGVSSMISCPDWPRLVAQTRSSVLRDVKWEMVHMRAVKSDVLKGMLYIGGRRDWGISEAAYPSPLGSKR